jgi:hypothetical protein
MIKKIIKTKKLKTIMIINGNQKDKFRRKHIVKITFRKKECCNLKISYLPPVWCVIQVMVFKKKKKDSN